MFLLALNLGKCMLLRYLQNKVEDKPKIMNYQIEDIEFLLMYLCPCVTKCFESTKIQNVFFLNLWMKFIFQEKSIHMQYLLSSFLYMDIVQGPLFWGAKKHMSQRVHETKAIQLLCTPFSDTGYRDTVLCRSVTGNVVWSIKATNNLGIFLLLFFIVWW